MVVAGAVGADSGGVSVLAARLGMPSGSRPVVAGASACECFFGGYLRFASSSHCAHAVVPAGRANLRDAGRLELGGRGARLNEKGEIDRQDRQIDRSIDIHIYL